MTKPSMWGMLPSYTGVSRASRTLHATWNPRLRAGTEEQWLVMRVTSFEEASRTEAMSKGCALGDAVVGVKDVSMEDVSLAEVGVCWKSFGMTKYQRTELHFVLLVGSRSASIHLFTPKCWIASYLALLSLFRDVLRLKETQKRRRKP